MSPEDNPFLAGAKIPPNEDGSITVPASGNVIVHFHTDGTPAEAEYAEVDGSSYTRMEVGSTAWTEAPWMYLSRWRALPTGPKGEWEIVSEVGTVAAEPNTFTDHGPAQTRADDLNAQEHDALTRRLNKEAQ